MDENDNYVYKKEITMKQIRIPDDCVKCPDCKGSGEVRIIYGAPWVKGQFDDCLLCCGKGYVEKSHLEFLQRLEEKRREKTKK